MTMALKHNLLAPLPPAHACTLPPPSPQLLSVDSEAHQGHGSCSVFELSGCDSTGLLAAVLQLMVSNNLEVTSAAVSASH